MNIYIVSRIQSPKRDEYEGFVIVAQSEGRAREIANSHRGAEGDIWTNKYLVACDQIVTREEGIVLSSFKGS